MRPTIFTIVLLIIAAGALVGLGWFTYHLATDDRGYVAVLLTTGDVYFGKVSTPLLGDYVTLTKSYYPQTFTNEIGEEELRLVKVGSEFHLPKDAVRINKEQITMIQSLESASPVITSIQEYEASQQ